MTRHIRTGHCLCGSIQYRVDGPTVWSGYCHCESCRRFSGSVVTNWLGVRDNDLVFTAGKPAIYEKADVRRGFCPDCGASLTYQSGRFPGYIQLHLGTLDDPDACKPQAHVHVAGKVAWFDVNDGLPRFEGSAADEGEDW